MRGPRAANSVLERKDIMKISREATTMADNGLDRFVMHISDQEFAATQRIQNVLLREMQNFAFDQRFIQIMPLILSPITDPLNHSVYSAAVQYEETKLKLTASMIFHKQLALMSSEIDKILIVSPNVRLEQADIKSSDNHLIEFSQFDIEMKNASMEEVMTFIESLYLHLFERIEDQNANELDLLKRRLPKFEKPFPRYNTEKRGNMEVEEFCRHISESTDVPCFVTNFEREFYDREDPERRGTYRNFDLIYPEGYGEALSGAEREFRYDAIVCRMKERNMDLRPYGNYLALAKKGLIPRTAGAGIGIQRLLKFISGRKHIADVCIFDRSVTSKFVF